MNARKTAEASLSKPHQGIWITQYPNCPPPKVVSNIWKVRNLIGLGFRLKLNLALAEKRSTGAQRNCNSINGESSSLFADARSNESVQENQIFGPDSVNHGFQN